MDHTGNFEIKVTAVKHIQGGIIITTHQKKKRVFNAMSGEKQKFTYIKINSQGGMQHC